MSLPPPQLKFQLFKNVKDDWTDEGVLNDSYKSVSEVWQLQIGIVPTSLRAVGIDGTEIAIQHGTGLHLYAAFAVGTADFQLAFCFRHGGKLRFRYVHYTQRAAAISAFFTVDEREIFARETGDDFVDVVRCVKL